MYPTRQHFTFQTPLIKHEFARQSICFRYPLIFNNMSLIIRDTIYVHSPEGYKNYIKKRMIQSYSDECLTPYCYICGRNS